MRNHDLRAAAAVAPVAEPGAIRWRWWIAPCFDGKRATGIDGLGVIDASVMPAVASTNINAATIMIVEEGAALI